VLVQAANLSALGGCHNGTPNSFSITVPAVPNGLMLVRLENGTGPSAATSITFNGALFTLLRSDPGYAGSLSTYYLLAPSAGTYPVVVNGISGCSWNVVYELYASVNQASPVGASAAGSGTLGAGVSFSASVNTVASGSLLSNFMQTDQMAFGNGTLFTGVPQVPINFASNCCETIFGDYLAVGGAGAHTMKYQYSQAGKRYAYQLVELKRAICPTATPTPRFKMTPSADSLPGTIFPFPQPARANLVRFAYFMRKPGQARLRVFNANGVALGGLSEHAAAGPTVSTLEVSAFANGVYYFQMEIRYDAGDREMLKVGKFLIARR